MVANAPQNSWLNKIYNKNYVLKADQLDEKTFLKNKRCFLETTIGHFLRFTSSAFMGSWFESETFNA